MKWKYVVFIFIAAAIITNLPVINKNFMLLFDGEGHFRYSNADASFTQVQRLGFKDPNISDWSINNFIEDTQPAPENREVYRLYRINPLCFWRWTYYIGVSRDFKYKSWKEIEPNRIPYNPNHRWQNF